MMIISSENSFCVNNAAPQEDELDAVPNNSVPDSEGKLCFVLNFTTKCLAMHELAVCNL